MIEAQGNGVGSGKWLWLVCGWMVVSQLAMGAYYDGTAGDKQIAYGFLDQVEAEVGGAEFESVGYDHALHLALTLGRIDRDTMTSQAFVGHVRSAEKVRQRFYRRKPLSDEEFEAYLLPFRIRYEPTAKPGWLVTLAARFQPLVANAATADDAAKVIAGWLAENLRVLGQVPSYKLPQRGDLDPMAVLEGGGGNEVDLAICGVAALRSVGVAARFVWTPALRGEIGGKAWLEYLGESCAWLPWVPSFGVPGDHLAAIRQRLGAKILNVLARPEAPVAVTEAYVETIRLVFDRGQEDVVIDILAIGRDELLPAMGGDPEAGTIGREARIGRGRVVIAASFANRSFALLPVDCPSDAGQQVIHVRGGTLVSERGN